MLLREKLKGHLVRAQKISRCGFKLILNMSSENDSNGNCDDSQLQGQESNSSAKAKLTSHEKTECLISLVEKYKLLYDLEDKNHRDKWKTANAWDEISKEIGESVSWCKSKWKATKEYYFGLKSGKKGKSGQQRGKGITWPFFKMMSFLDGTKNSNENTMSNLDFSGPAKVARTDDLASASGNSANPVDLEDSSQSTRVESSTPKSSLPVKKRGLNFQDELNMKMIEYLDKSSQSLEPPKEEPPDEISCWCRLVESRLRQLHPSQVTPITMECDQIVMTALQAAHSYQRIHTYNHETENYEYRQQ